MEKHLDYLFFTGCFARIKMAVEAEIRLFADKTWGTALSSVSGGVSRINLSLPEKCVCVCLCKPA